MNSVKFDQIHTEKKQRLLAEMMQQVNDEVCKVLNPNDKMSTCPVCQTQNIEFYKQVFNFNMSKCNDCGLIFCNPYPSDKQLDIYYNSEMKEFENEFFRDSFDKRVELFLPRIQHIKKFKSKGTLLDVGSALGVFIEALSQSESEFEVTCLDVNSSACEELTENYPNCHVVNKNIIDFECSPHTFDVITLWDTIEHITDLHSLLTKIRKLLKKEGIFVFSTPNTKSFEWDIASKNHVQLLPPGHVNLLNPRSAEILLDSNNMKLISLETMNPQLDIGYVLKFLKKHHSNSTDPLGRYFLELLSENQLFKTSFESFLKDEKYAGNMLAVCTKK